MAIRAPKPGMLGISVVPRAVNLLLRLERETEAATTNVFFRSFSIQVDKQNK